MQAITIKMEDKLFVGPILSNLHSANYGVHRNMETSSHFISEYGAIFLASDIKDSSKNHIMGGEETKNESTPEYEKIYNVCENTIIPALHQKFKRWRNVAIVDYSRIFSNKPILREVKFTLEVLKGEFFAFRVLIPIIVTTKPILVPILDERAELKDVKEIPFLVYEHSVMNPDKYFELMFNAYDVLVFICNERGFDKLMEYVNGMADKIFDEISGNLSKHPNRFYEDYEDIQRQEKEIQDRHKL